MASKLLRGILIDDVTRDRERDSNHLSVPRKLRVTGISYDESTIQRVIDARPDIVFVDYQLVTAAAAQQAGPTQGSTVAAQLREKFPEIPILLITRGTLFNRGGLEASRDVPGAFDDILIKGEISRHLDKERQRVLSIIRGFKSLRLCADRSIQGLYGLLQATEDEMELLDRAAPPRPPRGGDRWRVTEAARWVRNTVIEYPGILYDPLHAASFLGISEKSFLTEAPQKFFAKARYNGIFAPMEGRWWKPRLMQIALKFLDSCNSIQLPLFHFGAVWNEHNKPHISLSNCIVEGARPAECVCYIYQKPVKRANSLPYRPDNRPLVMDEARVSFKAVRESSEFDGDYVASDAKCLIADIQENEQGS